LSMAKEELAIRQQGGYLVKDIVKAFEEGHGPTLSTEDRRYVVQWLRMTRPYMRIEDVARLLGCDKQTIKADCLDLDVSMRQTINDLDVSLILSEYGLQVKKAVESISRSIEEMEESPKGRTSQTYLRYVRSIPELYTQWFDALKSGGLIGEDHVPQEEYRYKTVTHKDGTILSETVIKKVSQETNKAKEILQKRLNTVEGEAIESEDSEPLSSNTTIQ